MTVRLSPFPMKRARIAIRSFLFCIPLLLVLPCSNSAEPSATALPLGGIIVSGRGNITSNGAAMNIRQETDKLITEWNAFDIGQAATVRFQQPSHSSIALNRVNSMERRKSLEHFLLMGRFFLSTLRA